MVGVFQKKVILKTQFLTNVVWTVWVIVPGAPCFYRVIDYAVA